MTQPTSSTDQQTPDFIFQLAAPPSAGEGSAGACFAARTSGLFRSKDGGQTWESAYESLNLRQALLTSAVALAPDFGHDPTVFAGLNGALLRSFDGGVTWQRCRLPSPPPAISTLAISPQYAEDGIVFAGTNEDGVLKSSDGGRNWVAWNFGLLDLNVLCLAPSPEFGTDEMLFAGVGSGLFRSSNGGRAWKEVALPFDFDAVLSLAISPDFARDQTVFIGTENNGLWTSSDQGKSWHALVELGGDEAVNQIQLVSTSPTEKEMLILFGGKPLVSKDLGKSWKPWQTKALGGRNVTSILVTGTTERHTLVGFEDGAISQI